MINMQVEVLLIEDNHGDAGLIAENLRECNSCCFQMTIVESLAAGSKRLSEGGIDIILLDLSLPDSLGFDTFTALRKKAGQVPIIVLTGFDDEETAIRAVQGGAQDYLIKGKVDSISLSRSIRYAIERQLALARLHATTLTDELTGLYNRRGFLNLARHQLKISDRTKRPLLLIFADIDDMKWINDSFGHPQGDLALIDAAAILRQTFRQSDVIARIGGDEFAILALDTTMNESEVIMTRLREKSDSRNLESTGPFRLSMSLGFSPYNAENHPSIEELLALADAHMYEHKRNKQKVC